MSINRHVNHCQKCIFITRQLTHSAVGKDSHRNARDIAKKLLASTNAIKRKNLTMQSQSKILGHLKDYLSKSGLDKNLQHILSKDWIDMLQKVTYSRIDTIRKLSLTKIYEAQVNADATQDAEKSKNDICKDTVTLTAVPNVQEEQIIDSSIIQAERFKNNKQNTEQIIEDVKSKLKEPQSIPQLLSGLLVKITNKSKIATLSTSPKWKHVRTDIPKQSIISRTRHVLNSITTAESSASKWRRIEDLLDHINQYPEARYYAIKEGAVPILLKARYKAKDEQIKGSIREALAVIGYVDPPKGRGIRILSIDGGGVRGVLVLEMLKKLEELTGKRTHQMFDYICGVSTGAILATALGGHKRKSLNEILELYKEMSTRIFTQNTLKGTSSLVWSHAYYDTALWEKLLRENLGDKELIKTARDPNSPKFSAISAVVNHARVMAYIFRNYTLPYKVESQYMGSYKHKLWEAARASAAAPSYFEEFKHGGFLHQDGGILVNNPCAVAIHEAKQLWPNSSIQCVISFGTGRIPHKLLDIDKTSTEVVISSWREKFYKILDSATDTEAVHTMLNDLLSDDIYFRFNPYLTEMLSMVEIRPDKLSQLERDAKMYIRRNEEKFERAAKALSEKRNISQKIIDSIALHKTMAGL